MITLSLVIGLIILMVFTSIPDQINLKTHRAGGTYTGMFLGVNIGQWLRNRRTGQESKEAPKRSPGERLDDGKKALLLVGVSILVIAMVAILVK